MPLIYFCVTPGRAFVSPFFIIRLCQFLFYLSWVKTIKKMSVSWFCVFPIWSIDCSTLEAAVATCIIFQHLCFCFLFCCVLFFLNRRQLHVRRPLPSGNIFSRGAAAPPHPRYGRHSGFKRGRGCNGRRRRDYSRFGYWRGEISASGRGVGRSGGTVRRQISEERRFEDLGATEACASRRETVSITSRAICWLDLASSY